MLRTITLVFLAAVFGAPSVAGDLAKSTIRYECEQINPTVTGFSCSIKNSAMNGLQFHLMEPPEKISKERVAEINYRIRILKLRHYQAGGQRVTITGNHWPKDKAKQCYPTRSRQSDTCQMCSGKNEYGGWNCNQ